MGVAGAPQTFEDIPVLHPPVWREEVLALPDSQRTQVNGSRKLGSTVPRPRSTKDTASDYGSEDSRFESWRGRVEIASGSSPEALQVRATCRGVVRTKAALHIT